MAYFTWFLFRFFYIFFPYLNKKEIKIDDHENTYGVISAFQTKLRFSKSIFGIDTMALPC